MSDAPGLRERLWWSASPSASDRLRGAPLLLAEGLFRAGAAVRGALYDAAILPAARAGVPVVSVGNLAVGGAGKTPVALAIAALLLDAGRSPAVLSRGYGATRTDDRVVSDGERLLLDAASGGDEPVLLARRLPRLRVLCGPDRARLAGRAVAMGADVLLLDDGFQHRRLARDLDVVVVDASNPWGNGHCLPFGPNREPRSALRRAGLVWLTHADRAPPEALAAAAGALPRRHRARPRRVVPRAPGPRRRAARPLLPALRTRGAEGGAPHRRGPARERAPDGRVARGDRRGGLRLPGSPPLHGGGGGRGARGGGTGRAPNSW